MHTRLAAVSTALVAILFASCAPAPQAESSPSEEPIATTNVRVESQGPSAEPTPTAPAVPACSAVAQGLPLEQRVGQLYMVGASTQGLDEATRQAVTSGSLGWVLLLGTTDAGVQAVSELTAELTGLDAGPVPLVVAVDQEGGEVQRLQGEGFSTIPAAVSQAELGSDELREAAYGWGRELGNAGVLFDLAPVADVVPPEKQESNQPIGALGRNYGTSVQVTSAAVTSFVTGMHDAGIATSLKHFPGLGQVVENTDEQGAVDTDVSPGDPDWASFVAGIDAGASSVMISSAVFGNIDPDNQAVFSSQIITDILRGELGYEGIVISDDLGAAGSVSDVPPADRGVRFIAAGGDIVINADPSIMAEMTQATVAKAESDPDFAAQVDAAAGRVLELKAWLGQVDCS
ncbi:MAG: glycoside hydrolase family 3 N-terminal domain-containing protein [Arachnia sp.]